MNKESFGVLPNKQPVFLYTIENEDLLVKLSDYGATLVSLVDKKSGKDLVLGFDDVSGYLKQTGHIGGTVGRVCNRIKGASFTMNGEVFELSDNDHGNTLHGGNIGLDKRMYDVVSHHTNAIVFSCVSPHLEDGFPGNLHLEIIYEIYKRSLRIEARVKSDRDTIFGFTNHSYFNLDQSDSILDHEVKILSDQVAYNDDSGCATPILHHVENTVFDFREFKPIKQDIHADHEQLIKAKGYDHCYVIPNSHMRDMAIVRKDHLQVVIASDLPCMHFYTGNYLENDIGKNGKMYPYQSGVCFEPEFFPNAINEPSIAFKPILAKDRIETQTIIYRIEDVYPSAEVKVSYSSREKEIPAIISFPSEKINPPFVIMCHDQFADKNESHGYDRLAKALSNVGIASMRMDFSGCGESCEPFENNCLTNMKIDVLAGIDYLKKNFHVSKDAMGILGYAMGGRVCMELLKDRVIDPKASVFIAPLYEFEDIEKMFSKSGFHQLYEKTKMDPYHKTRFKDESSRTFELSQQYFEDLKKHSGPYLVEQLKRSYENPMHVIYASDDPKVSNRSMEYLIQNCHASSTMILTNQHDFGFHEDNLAVYQTVEDAITNFFMDHLVEC